MNNLTFDKQSATRNRCQKPIQCNLTLALFRYGTWMAYRPLSFPESEQNNFIITASLTKINYMKDFCKKFNWFKIGWRQLLLIFMETREKGKSQLIKMRDQSCMEIYWHRRKKRKHSFFPIIKVALQLLTDEETYG